MVEVKSQEFCLQNNAGHRASYRLYPFLYRMTDEGLVYPGQWDETDRVANYRTNQEGTVRRGIDGSGSLDPIFGIEILSTSEIPEVCFASQEVFESQGWQRLEPSGQMTTKAESEKLKESNADPLLDWIKPKLIW